MQDERGVATTVAPAPGRVLNSDPHDFAGLYLRHRTSFTLHARRYLRDGRDADEVVQEAFLRLFLALPELETELQALAYCRRTITNLCIDRYRAQARRPSLVDLDSAGCAELADEDPGDPVVRAEDAALVREALSLLSPLHRAALVKREIEEKPFPVIAAELDIAEDSVKHVLFRARRALRRILVSTSLAPGRDGEISAALSTVARAGSGGLAGFLLLFALSLGTGPDLRAIPVVGTDLPELIPVTEMAQAVGEVMTDVAASVKAATGGTSPAGTADESADAEPLPVADPSPSSPAPAPVRLVEDPASTASPSASSSPAAGVVEASPTGTAAPSPSTEASASASPNPSPEGSPSTEGSPLPEGSPSPDGSASPTPTSPTPTPSPTSAESYRAPTAEPPATGDPTAEPTADTGDADSGEPELTTDRGATGRALLPPIG